ncbi:efflux RND transporter permease subunit [Oricola cellulosilytica]|nr:efflux RND transporter permease subunit [Oricola cellulosilytica]
MAGLFSLCVRFRYVISLSLIAALLFGLANLRAAPVDLLPEFQPTRVEIQTEALGLSAEEVESLITVPLEVDLLNSVSWVETIQSQSMPGLSSIVLTFEEGTNLFRARQLVQERLTQAHALPNVSKPPVLMQPLSSTSRVVQVAMSSDTLSLIDLSVAARWTMRPRLLGVPGVANVSIWGQRKRQLQVQVDPLELSASGVSLDTVVEAAGNALWYSPLGYLEASSPGSGGFIDTPNQRLGIQHRQPISTPDQLARVAVRGTEHTLGDVATIVESHPPLIGDAAVGDGRGLILVVEKFPWASTSEVAAGVEEALTSIRAGMPGVTLDTSVFKPAGFLSASGATLLMTITIGTLVSLVAVFVLTRDWHDTAIISLTAATSLALSANIALWLMSGIDLVMISGLLAATGLVFADAFLSNRTSAGEIAARIAGKRSPARLSYAEGRGVSAYATLGVLLMSFPLLLLDGVAGRMSTSFFVAFVSVAVVTFVISSILPPALASILASWRQQAGSDDEYMQPPEIPKRDGVLFARAKPFVLIGVVILPFVAAAGFASMPLSFAPEFKERDIEIRWNAAPGTSSEAMYRLASMAMSEIRKLEGVSEARAHVGRAEVSDRIVNLNAADIWITLDQDARYNSTINAIREIANSYAGISADLLTYSGDRIAAESGRDDAVTIRLFGFNPETLKGLADEVASVVSDVPGLGVPEVLAPVEKPVIKITPDLQRAREYGLKPGDIRLTSAVLLSGLEVGNLFEEQKIFDVIVWGKPHIRHSVSSVKDLLIETPTNQLVRLADVADVEVAPMPTEIRRDASSRFIDVRVSLVSGDASAMSDVISQRLATLQFPLEYHAEIRNGRAEIDATAARIRNGLLLSLLGVFLIAQAALGRWSLAGGALVAFVASLSGGIAVSAFVGGLSIGSIAGLLAVSAVALPALIFMLQSYQEAERLGVPLEAVLNEFAARANIPRFLGPGLVSTAFLLPVVFLGSAPGLEILRPMSMVLLGGMVTVSLVCFFAIPSVYRRLGVGSGQEKSSLFENNPNEGGLRHAT